MSLCGLNLFLLSLTNIPLYAAIVCLFIHPVEGHLNCFQVLSSMNKATISMILPNFLWVKVSAHLVKHRGAQLLDRMVRICLVL